MYNRLVRTSLFLCLAFFLVLIFSGEVFPHVTFAETVVERREQLEKDLTALEAQIEKERVYLDAKKNERVSLERDVSILTSQIKKAKLSIQARVLSIQKLSTDIGERQKKIVSLSSKIDAEKESLSEIFRKMNEITGASLPEVMLSSKDFSVFFEDVNSFEVLERELKASFDLLAEVKDETVVEREALEDRREEEVKLREIQELEKRRIEEQESEKTRILKITKGVETEYQKLIKVRERDAAKIRTELFTLQGSAAIPFEKALALAEMAGKRMGIRPAFLLGIIAEETNLGANIGTGTWRVDMKAPRDTEPFLDITRRLGLDPDKMPVSKKPWYGYGGAMGPAQFIPSTWIMYEEKIANATGHRPPNPWNPEDAFMASAILLSESGAKKQTVAGERYAALCYLAGCKNATKKAYQFYADDVMDLAAKYQRQIDILGG